MYVTTGKRTIPNSLNSKEAKRIYFVVLKIFCGFKDILFYISIKKFAKMLNFKCD